MKKRSLVAAIAMLIVSAIVLTSSTYAWFASSASAEVDDISATVTNNNGSISVAPTGTNAKAAVKDIFKTKITANDYENLCSQFKPVSMYISGSAPQFNKVDYDTETFDNFDAATANDDYMTYQFKVKAKNAAGTNVAAKSVTLTPQFTTNNSGFCNGLIAVTTGSGESVTTTYYSYLEGGSYEALKGISDQSGAITDSNGNAIVDAGDTGLVANTDLLASSNFSGVTAGTNNAAITVLSNIAANTEAVATITVWVWAEGQDQHCTGNVNAETAYFEFDLA